MNKSVIYKLDHKGTALTEVALMAALIAITALASLGFVGENVEDTYIITANAIQDANEINPGGGIKHGIRK